MRKIYVPYVLLSWALIAIASIDWLSQLVLFLYHDSYSDNASLMVMQSLFVIYIAWQHTDLFLYTENSDKNPHFQMAFLMLLSALFALHAWWLFCFVLLFVHSNLIATPLSQLVIMTYQLLEKQDAVQSIPKEKVKL